MSTRTRTQDELGPVTAPIDDALLRRDVADVLAGAGRLLGGPDHGDGDAPPTLDVVGARLRVDDATTALTESLRSDGDESRQADGVTRDEVVDLLLELRDVAARLVGAEEADRRDAFGRVREAMAMLRGVTSAEQMLERAPMAAARLGFDRTFVSAIEDAYFIPRAAFFDGDLEWAEAVVRAGQEEPRRLDRTLMETEMVRRRQPICVRDAQNDPRVHRGIAEVSLSRSYVAAPVIVQDEVIGFIHADYYRQRRPVGPLDTDLLGMFTQAFGFAYERMAYAERIVALRRSYLQTMADAEHDFTRAIEDGIRLGVPAVSSGDAAVSRLRPAPAPVPAAGIAAPSGLDGLLTRREVEVLRLMASGATNDGIASRLVISHGTAKTHVKHILRKLSAANRAEAVSRYFQLEHRAEIAG